MTPAQQFQTVNQSDTGAESSGSSAIPFVFGVGFGWFATVLLGAWLDETRRMQLREDTAKGSYGNRAKYRYEKEGVF